MTSLLARGCGHCNDYAWASRTVACGKEGHRAWRIESLLGDGGALRGMHSSRIAARARAAAHEDGDDDGVRLGEKARTVGGKDRVAFREHLPIDEPDANVVWERACLFIVDGLDKPEGKNRRGNAT